MTINNVVKAKTRSQEQIDDVTALLRARNPLLWIVSREEQRVELCLAAASKAAKYKSHTWDVAAGARELPGGGPSNIGGNNPDEMLEAIEKRTIPDPNNMATEDNPKRDLWVMRDLLPWITGIGGAVTLRRLRNLVRILPGTPRLTAQIIVVLSPSGEVPPELADHATVIEWPLPDRVEMTEILDKSIAPLGNTIKALPNSEKQAAVDAAVGLTEEEAKSCYAKSLVKTRGIDVAIISQEKKRVIAREKVLEWMSPLSGGLDSVGGLDVLKKWLLVRATAYSAEARTFGLPLPKGLFIVGISGTGKTLTAKAVATAWNVPLLRFDFGALKGKFVGESEARIRSAYRVIEAMGRCVVLVDEIEKGLQGATSGSSDGGVSADALGSFLTWMQERTSEAFVVATANDITALPPEMLRKGRFDEIFFVDLPNLEERKEILNASLRANNRAPLPPKATAQVAAQTVNFTGAEIASIVPEAMFAAFADRKREITRDDLLAAAKGVVPLIKTTPEKIKHLQDWAASGKAKLATSVQTSTNVVKHGREVEFEDQH